jgi:hypothetical protein
MGIQRHTRFGFVFFALGLATATTAAGGTAVNVQLIDKGTDTPIATGLTYGTPGIDLTKATSSV